MAKKYDESSITVLEGLEAVRKRPGMYIGSTGTRGLNHLIYEIVDNSVDEHLAGYGNTIKVTLNDDGSCTVEDEGRGVPVGKHPTKKIPSARLVFTVLHAGGKFDNDSYKVSGGLHGVGSSVVNALSTKFDVEISREGYVWHDYYEKGVPKENLVDGLLPALKKIPASRTGTKITFTPDPSIFEKTKFGAEDVKARLHETCYLNPSLTIIFSDQRKGADETITYYEPDGLIGYIKGLTKGTETVGDVVTFSGEFEGTKVDIAYQFTTESRENIFGYTNNVPNPEGGTHLTGFKTAFTQQMNLYAKAIGVLKEKDPSFTGPEIRSGLVGVVSVAVHQPRFEGQTKTKLDNPEVARAVSKVVTDQIQLYYDKNLQELKNVLALAEKAAKVHKAEEKARNAILAPKSKFSFDSNGKLSNCESKDPTKTEIFIVEGDSAGGSAKMARNRNFQAVLPLRGKILNVEKASSDKLLANAEIKTMIYAFGCGVDGFGSEFDLANLRYDKIIIMADADVDGAHIACLCLTFLYRYMPQLIASGHVYVACPPLYKVVSGRGGEGEYLYDDEALENYRKSHKNFTLQRYKGLGEMDAEQLWETTMDPRTRLLKRISIDDAKYASETTALLMGNDVGPRREFIVEGAREATLDV